MRPALSTKFIEKAEAAFVAAIEIYNKPSFLYREETFALLAINAWELLLKAQLLKQGGNDPKAIRVYETRPTKMGKASKKKYLKRNRSGSPLTRSLFACVSELEKTPISRLGPEIKANLDALVAIRDSAAHYIHASPILSKQVVEIALASVKNFVTISKGWFQRDFSDALSLILPLSFLSGAHNFDSVVVTKGESQLIKYLQTLAAIDPATGSPYSIAIGVQIKMERSKLTTASKVQVTNDPDAVKVFLTEQNVLERYPWDYKELGARCAARYADFKIDSKYHDLRKPTLSDARYAYSRFLNPANPKSGRKDFYSPAIFDILDKQYTQK